MRIIKSKQSFSLTKCYANFGINLTDSFSIMIQYIQGVTKVIVQTEAVGIVAHSSF